MILLRVILQNSLAPWTPPYEGGMMILDVRDGTDCFALGSLLNGQGIADRDGLRQFRSLLLSLGWPDNDAQSLTGVLTDWIDTDTQRGPSGAEDGDYLRRTPPHRTANTALSSVMELRNRGALSIHSALFMCA